MSNSDAFITILLTFGSLSVFTGVSYAIMITYLILRKFNDFGDSSCKLDDYSPRGIGYMRMIDDVPSNGKFFLFTEYGSDPYVVKHQGIPEILIKNSEKNNEQEY